MDSFLDRYTAAVQSGFSLIPASIEMEDLYGPCDHFIGHQPGANTQRWNTEVIVEGRYELTMQCEVRMSSAFDKVLEVVSEPVFCVKEIERIEILDDGRAAAKFSSTNSRFFGLKEWNDVVAANGDLSSIGIAFRKGAPVDHVREYSRQVSAPRVSVRPCK